MNIHYKWPFSSSQTVNVDQAGSLKQMSKMSFRFPGSEPESLRGSAGHPWRLLSHDGAMVLVEKWKKNDWGFSWWDPWSTKKTAAPLGSYGGLFGENHPMVSCPLPRWKSRKVKWIPMTDPWCCYIWQHGSRQYTPVFLAVSIYTSTMDPFLC